MSSPIIKIENLSKQYRLGAVGTGTIRNDLKRWWYRARGKEDPFLKIGETNQRNTKGKSDYVWALKDINMEVMPGEILGIIGKNGAGKSTLLKILSKVTGPTTGNISFNGRIGSLLEVGTGFHPELTGRENIFLNGAILGMTKVEIRNKLDEIIDFSGVKRYVDTPVKRYSSGMMVRLGFAVAAHLEPEILVVDEVLAVGDAEFQKKAIGKMQDVSKNEGRTVLFVSHNMAAVKTLCKTAIILENGMVTHQGTAEKLVPIYLHNNIKLSGYSWLNKTDKTGLHFNRINIINIINQQPNLQLLLEIDLRANESFKDSILAFIIKDDMGAAIFQVLFDKRISFSSEKKTYKIIIDLPPLIPGNYLISAWMGPHNGITCDFVEHAVSFSIMESPMKNWIYPFFKKTGHFIIQSDLG